MSVNHDRLKQALLQTVCQREDEQQASGNDTALHRDSAIYARYLSGMVSAALEASRRCHRYQASRNSPCRMQGLCDWLEGPALAGHRVQHSDAHHLLIIDDTVVPCTPAEYALLMPLLDAVGTVVPLAKLAGHEPGRHPAPGRPAAPSPSGSVGCGPNSGRSIWIFAVSPAMATCCSPQHRQTVKTSDPMSAVGWLPHGGQHENNGSF